MKVSLTLTDGSRLTLEPLAGHVVLQLLRDGTKPATASMDTAAAAVLIDLLGLVAVTAEEQAHELDVAVALIELRARKPELFTGPCADALADLAIPAYLRPLQ